MNDGLHEQERTTGTFLLLSSKMIVDFEIELKLILELKNRIC